VLEEEVDEKHYLDNERAQQLVATITDSNEIGYVPYKEGGKQHQSNTVYDKEKVAPTIEARDYKGAKQILEPKIKQIGNTTPNPKRENPQTGRTYDADGLAPTLNTMQGGNRQPQIIEPLGTLASGASEQFGVGYMDGLSKTLKANNHDISVLEGIPIKNNTDQGYLIAKEKFGRMGEQAVRTQNKLRLPHGETLNPWNEEQSSVNGVSPTLTTRPEGFKTAINVTDQYRIRKLTPLECFRLMGVTDEDFYKAQEVNSNTQLYKQAGNSIVVSVLEAIFRNMFLEVPEEDLIGEHIPLF